MNLWMPRAPRRIPQIPAAIFFSAPAGLSLIVFGFLSPLLLRVCPKTVNWIIYPEAMELRMPAQSGRRCRRQRRAAKNRRFAQWLGAVGTQCPLQPAGVE